MNGTAAIGFFGGTFNPVHFGHLRAASEAAEILKLSSLFLLPAADPPLREPPAATPEQRLQMLRLALRGQDDLLIDDRELHRSGPSYTVDTLRSLRVQYPQAPLVLIIGQDAANQLHRWHHWAELFDLAHIAIMTRPDSQPEYSAVLNTALSSRQASHRQALHQQPHGLIHHFPITPLAISATAIRELIKQGRNPRFLLPDPVLEYIHAHQLYQH
ncbi:MAG: nicotinate-nucleotide adenylyltransferase [Wenzhouxiangellaceae bacterium]